MSVTTGWDHIDTGSEDGIVDTSSAQRRAIIRMANKIVSLRIMLSKQEAGELISVMVKTLSRIAEDYPELFCEKCDELIPDEGLSD